MNASMNVISIYEPNAEPAPEPIFTVIAPVHNEESVLEAFAERVSAVLDQTGEAWEILLVDDGSTDHSAAMIAQLCAENDRIRGISLSRNYGFQVAVSAGLDHAQGQAVILIDADLQDPPEVILQMIERWQEGYDVVYGVRGKREGETWFKKFSAGAFYRVIQNITSIDIPLDTGDFRLMDRRVVDALRAMPERTRFLRGMVSWVGYKQTGVVYQRHSRFAGESKFTLGKMLRFALDAITGFSYFPLQLASYIGFLFAGLSAFAIVAVIGLRMFGADSPLLGQATTLVSVLFLGGVQLIFLGIIGEYLGRIYDEVKARPLYLIQKTWGMQQN